MLNIKPLGDQILVQVIADQKVTAGGIVIPESARLNNGAKKALVAELGEFPWADDKRSKRWGFGIGDVVLVRNGAGISVKVGDHDCELVSNKDVLGVALLGT